MTTGVELRFDAVPSGYVPPAVATSRWVAARRRTFPKEPSELGAFSHRCSRDARVVRTILPDPHASADLDFSTVDPGYVPPASNAVLLQWGELPPVGPNGFPGRIQRFHGTATGDPYSVSLCVACRIVAPSVRRRQGLEVQHVRFGLRLQFERHRIPQRTEQAPNGSADRICRLPKRAGEHHQPKPLCGGRQHCAAAVGRESHGLAVHPLPEAWRPTGDRDPGCPPHQPRTPVRAAQCWCSSARHGDGMGQSGNARSGAHWHVSGCRGQTYGRRHALLGAARLGFLGIRHADHSRVADGRASRLRRVVGQQAINNWLTFAEPAGFQSTVQEEYRWGRADVWNLRQYVVRSTTRTAS